MPIMALGRKFFPGSPPSAIFVFDKPRIDYIFYLINIKKSRNNNRYYSVISYGYMLTFLFVGENLYLLLV
jgi:hypothetical protein